MEAYPCVLKDGTLAERIIWNQKKFQKDIDIDMNIIINYKEKLEKAGLICSGTSPDGKLVEIVEYKKSSIFYSRTISSRTKIKTK